MAYYDRPRFSNQFTADSPQSSMSNRITVDSSLGAPHQLANIGIQVVEL